MAKNIVGIDIDENSVNFVLCSGGEIKKAACAELPDNLVSGDKILSMDAMADFIRETVSKNNIPKGDAAIILPSSMIYVRNITIPAMTNQQLRYNLPFEFKDYLAEEKSKYIFDYAVLNSRFNEEGTATELDIFACAALRSTIDEYRMMLRRAGFKLKIAVPDEYALSSVIRAKLGDDKETTKCYCIADIGYKETYLYFYRGSLYNFKREIDFGFYDLERRIAENCDVDIHMAHNYVNTNYNNILKDEKYNEVYDSLAIEIMKAINFFNYNNRDLELDDLYVCGSTAVECFSDAIRRMINLKIHSVAELLHGGEFIENPWMYLLAYGSTVQSL